MVYICADDFGLSTGANRRIAACVGHGALNKISVFANGNFTEDMAGLGGKDVLWCLHLNLVEGPCLSAPGDLKLLTDARGQLCRDFISLLRLSLSGKKRQLEAELSAEIRAQLKKWISCLPDGAPLALDSHQHTHMIPLVFKTLLRVLKEEGIKAEYLRFPAEPILPYLKVPSLYFTYTPVNLMKQWLLKLLGACNKKALQACSVRSAYFMGVLFSGNMDLKRVEKVLPHYRQLAQKRGADIEVLFHPGYPRTGEAVWEGSKACFKKFYAASGRKTEYDTLMQMKK